MRMPWNRNKDEDFEEEELPEEHPIKGDRKIASVNKGLGVQARMTNFIIGALVIIAVGYFLFDYYAQLYKERAERQSTPVDTSQTAQTTVPPLKLGKFDEQQQPQAGTPPPQPNIQQGKGGNGQPAETPAQIERRERLGSSVKFKLDTGTTTAAAGQTGTPGTPGAPGNAGSGSGSGNTAGQDRLSQSLQGAQLDPIEAYKLGDPSLMVYQGESIPCTVQQAIDSSLVGQVTCIQSVDLWSADHSAIVAEAGTIYTGQQLMGLARGNRRLPIVWTRGRTPMPNNIAFNLNSAGTDELGRTGITGEIDNHLAERWGPIVALSLIDDVGAYLSATGQSNNSDNTNISFGNTTNGGQELATEIFKESANIPSTLTRNQGANIYIYLARDIDFSKVYSLEYKE